MNTARVTMGTRDDLSMRSFASRSTGAALRAALAEAERDGDVELARVLRAELARRAALHA